MLPWVTHHDTNVISPRRISMLGETPTMISWWMRSVTLVKRMFLLLSPGVVIAMMHSQRNGLSLRSCWEVTWEGRCIKGSNFKFCLRKSSMFFSAMSGAICIEVQTCNIELLFGEGIVGGGDGMSVRWQWNGDGCFDPEALESQSTGRPEFELVVCSKETILSSFASNWAVLEADERLLRFRTVGDGRQSFFNRWHLRAVSL